MDAFHIVLVLDILKTLIVLLLNRTKSVLKYVCYLFCMIPEDSQLPLLLVCLLRAVPLMPCLCVSRKWMAATRWPVPPVNNISVGCVWAYLAKSTPTVTLTTHIHLVTTSEWFVFDPFSQCKPVDIFAKCVISCLFQTLLWCWSRWRRCLLEWRRGLTPVPLCCMLHLNALYFMWHHYACISTTVPLQI